MASGDVKAQLHVYHDPFSGMTSQPKIPDGKATHSLGFSTQSVSEISNRSGVNTMHFLLFPGMNSALVCSGATQDTLSRGYFIPQFLRSGVVDWSAATAGGDQEVTNPEGYAKWRVVSTGMQLKLLNSVEEDDGWWEACRVNEPVNSDQWRLTTVANGNPASIVQNGTIAPTGLATSLTGRQIANEPTYMTGLLRDLNRVQFECHPVTDEHDFEVMRDPIHLDDEDYTYTALTVSASLSRSTADIDNLIRNYCDFSHDMVYLRLHCRPNNGSSSLGSRFHVNVVSNQEIIYDTNDRLARYQTRAHNIGDGNMSAHANLRRGVGGAASMVS